MPKISDERWQTINTAPKDGTEIVVTGGELYDECGSPSFGGPYLVYWTTKHPRWPEGIWRIRAGFAEVAQVIGPTHWISIPPGP